LNIEIRSKPSEPDGQPSLCTAALRRRRRCRIKQKLEKYKSKFERQIGLAVWDSLLLVKQKCAIFRGNKAKAAFF